MPASPIAVEMLNFGRLLWLNSQKSAPDREESRITQAEEQLIALLYDESSPRLRRILDFSNNGRNVEPTTLRVLCLVAHLTLATTRLGTTVAEVACALGGENAARVLEARAAISNLLLRRQLALQVGLNDCVTLGRPILGFFAGGADAAPLVPTESELHRAWYKSEQATARRGAKAEVPPSAKQLALLIQEQGVVGLEPQTRVLSSRMVLHMRRAAMIRAGRDPGSPNECLLLIGPSGGGKTWLAESAGRVCGVPFGSISASDLSCTAYVGLGIDDGIKALIAASNNDVERARYGILFVDEWDKKRTSNWEFGGRDVAGASVQQEVLRLIEGTEFVVGGRRGSFDCPPTTFNSHGTAFVFAGAYTALQELLDERRGHGIGFGPQGGRSERRYLHDALVEYGMIEEFCNRLTGILVLPEPTLEQLREIARRCVLPSFNRVLAAFGAEIQVAEDGVRLMAEVAKEMKFAWSAYCWNWGESTWAASTLT